MSLWDLERPGPRGSRGFNRFISLFLWDVEQCKLVELVCVGVARVLVELYIILGGCVLGRVWGPLGRAGTETRLEDLAGSLRSRGACSRYHGLFVCCSVTSEAKNPAVHQLPG